MKKKDTAQKKADQLQTQKAPLSLMAIQEKLGLFKSRKKLQDKEEERDYLTKKPLGLI